MGILEVLTAIFVLGHFLGWGDLENWSWWALLSPMWIGYSVGFLLFMLFGGAALSFMRR